jgi:hypothetical protein
MKASILKVLVVTMSFAAVGLLSLSSGAADSSSSQTDPMGGCCGGQPEQKDEAPPIRCGSGTIARGNTCVNATK